MCVSFTGPGIVPVDLFFIHTRMYEKPKHHFYNLKGR